MQNIRYIKRADLDIAKWDACIDAAPNGLIYAYSFYLDAMCDNWDALVQDNYKAVMPLPWRKKWGIRYVYQPPFIQRLGIFGNDISNELINLFFQNANQKFKFIHYNVACLPQVENMAISTRKNLIIDLSVSYEEIKAQYTKECIKNIRKSQNRGCFIDNELKPEDVIENFKNVYGALNKRISNQDYQQFKRLIEWALINDKAFISGVKDDKNLTIFSAVILKDHKRLYYVLGSPTAIGRQKRAPYFFIDSLLKKFEKKNLLFDFEGSDIPNVANFYHQFTQREEHYFEIKINRLPIPLKFLKR